MKNTHNQKKLATPPTLICHIPKPLRTLGSLKEKKEGMLFGGYAGNAMTVKVLSFTCPVPANHTFHSILMVYVPALTLG
jgi:hypothetical protein